MRSAGNIYSTGLHFAARNDYAYYRYKRAKNKWNERANPANNNSEINVNRVKSVEMAGLERE